jgi:hypothetical protein
MGITVKELNCEISLTGNELAVQLVRCHIQVGRALSIWATVESVLAEYYCMLACGRKSPIDAAVTTYSELRSFDDRKNIISKCLDQVLYPKEFDEFRKNCKSKLNRIRNLSELRNKIAHGMAAKDEDDGIVKFYPYYNHAILHRKMAISRIMPNCVFRPSRPPIPAEAGHRFRTMPGRCDAVVGLSEMTTLSSTVFRFR